MRVVQYTQSEFLFPWRLRRRAELPVFILLIPYAVVRGVIPSRAALNEMLRTGCAGGGMGTGVYWQPLELSAEEYDAIVAEWKTRNAQHLLYPSGAGDFVEDVEILALEKHLEYLKRSKEKYSIYRPAAMPKRPLSSILLGLMCSTGILMLLSAPFLGLVLGLQERRHLHLDGSETLLVGVIVAAVTAAVGGVFLGFGMLMARRSRRASTGDTQ
ncbi:MAG: hypothetical protein NTY53_25565 [Kiritimatiellaeota bacterium]|nr:hypothetical protein [Kiritimatiellota bacterium]